MKTRTKLCICLLIGVILTLSFILAIFTPANISPKNTQWVINGGGDNLQHYLGWRFFRNSSWSKHFLFMKDLNYPIGTSVIVTDSNPLFCLIFKLLDPVLPIHFQFNGLWILLSYLLIVLFATLISWKLSESIPLTIAAAGIAVLNPVILQRALIHDTLTAHWLILASIYLFINGDKKWNPIGWFILTEITLLVHIYFLPMIAFVLCLQFIRMLITKKHFTRIIVILFVFCFALGFGYYLFGYNYILPQSGSFGELSLNLNSFINPDGTSYFLQSRPELPLQYEGYNYWGAGLLLLVCISIVVSGKRIMRLIPYIIPTFLLILISASHIGYFDLQPVYQLEIPEKIISLLSVFRSSGRLVWPIYYLVLFYALVCLSDKKGNKFSNIIFLACLMLQFIDLSGFYKEAADRFRNPSNEIGVIPVESLSPLMNQTKHLYVSDYDAKIVDAFALYAADNKLTFNKSSNARGIMHIYGEDELDMVQMDCNDIKPESVYIYFEDNYPSNLLNCASVSIHKADEWTVFISK